VNRELLTAELTVTADGRLILRLVCDCATITDTDVTGAGSEFAITCDGCHSVRWIGAGEPIDG